MKKTIAESWASKKEAQLDPKTPELNKALQQNNLDPVTIAPTPEMAQDAKALALAKFLGADPSEVRVSSYDPSVYEFHNEEYAVLTDEEANARARDYILDSVWAFNKSFLDAHSDIIAGIDDDIWSSIQNKAESSNASILKMIPDKEHFVQDAINADGRGHFMSFYDGEENEQDGFYIYRTN